LQGRYNVREFRPEDLDAIVNINKVCLPENYSPVFFLEHHYEDPRIFLVAEVDGKVAGYNMCRVEFGVSNLKTAFARKGHVISIAVMQDYRRIGIGRRLMEMGMQRVKESGATEMFLEVRVSNNSAIELYRSLGFKVAKVAEGYYRDGENAYLMVADLSNLKVPGAAMS
jgi:ribosomal-protein-alanine N-acetyltransferase